MWAMLDYGDPMFFVIILPFFRRGSADVVTLTLCNGGQATIASKSKSLSKLTL